MIESCERRARLVQARRFSAEEFCGLAQTEAGSLYRPRSEVLRMLAVGEAFGLCGEGRQPDTAMLVLPAEADVSLAAALREIYGRTPHRRSFVLTPPVGGAAGAELLLGAAMEYLRRRTPGCPVRAVLECTPEAEQLVPAYLAQGFALCALRPLNSLAPCYVFSAAVPEETGDGVWIDLADATHLALLLCRGWAAVASRITPEGCALRMVPV